MSWIFKSNVNELAIYQNIQAMKDQLIDSGKILSEQKIPSNQWTWIIINRSMIPQLGKLFYSQMDAFDFLDTDWCVQYTSVSGQDIMFDCSVIDGTDYLLMEKLITVYNGMDVHREKMNSIKITNQTAVLDIR
jgi:hypothetical protein